MPLSKRQKRRLLEVSKMIESSIVVRDDMEEIQLEYAQEIDDIIEQISKSFSKSQDTPEEATNEELVPKSKIQQNIRAARELRKQKKRIRDAQKYEPPAPPEVDDAPEWAKRLWKAIAKKCHPDRLSSVSYTHLTLPTICSV